MKNLCCQRADLMEITAAGDPGLVIALECPCCGEFELTPAWDRLKHKLDRELSPNRLMPLSA